MPVRLDAALADVMTRLFAMARTAEEMVEAVIKTLAHRDPAMLQSVYEDEQKMDAMQLDVDDRTVDMIGVYTPVASDLRLLLMIPRVSGSLERIGDQTENICEHVQQMLEVGPTDFVADLAKMAETSRDMLRKAVKAFDQRSMDQALDVLNMDNLVDDIHDRVYEGLIESMERDSGRVRQCLNLMMITRAVERLGDHAVNIAEATIYAVSGKDVRHLHLEKAQAGGPTE